MSYLEENFSFEADDLRRTADGAVSYLLNSSSDISVSPSGADLIADLKSSVCMLQSDGLKQAFVHRSFQEYFAALFAVNLHSSKVKDILDKYVFRYGDHAISMALDMARESVEREWVVPTVDSLVQSLIHQDDESIGERFGRLIPNAFLHFDDNHFLISSSIRSNADLARYYTIVETYEAHFGECDL